MEVKLYHNYVVEANGAKWSVPQSYVSIQGAYTWVKLSSSCHGLARLLGADKKTKSFCSFKGSPGLEQLKHKRNSLSGLLQNEQPLFAAEAGKKRKRSAPKDTATEGHTQLVHLDLGPFGSLRSLKAKKKTEDLLIPLEKESLQTFLQFMLAEGVTFTTPSRKYQKTGQYSKKAEEMERKAKRARGSKDGLAEDDDDAEDSDSKTSSEEEVSE